VPADDPTSPGPSGSTGPAPGREPSRGGVGSLVGRGQAVLGRLDRWQQSNRPVALAVSVFKKFGDDRAGNLAALVSYYAFFSLFPLLLVLVTSLGFVLADNPEAQAKVLDSALGQFPVVGDEIRTGLNTFQGSGVALAVGLIGALWGGLGAMDAMQNAMNTIWGVPYKHRPNLIKSRLRSLGMLALFGGSLLATTVVGGASSSAGDWAVLGRVGVILVSIALNSALFLGAFKVLTDRPLPWAAHVPGALFAGVSFTALEAVGGLYVDHVVQGAGQVYGTFAVVLGLLSWLYVQAQFSVLAGEINVVRELGLAPRSLLGDKLTDADRLALATYAKVEERVATEKVTVAIDGRPAETGEDTFPAAPV
jgi:membrane protein